MSRVLCKTEHSSWAQRVDALKDTQEFYSILDECERKGKLREALKKLAAGFIKSLKANEGTVQFAILALLAALADKYGNKLALLPCAKGSALNDDTVLHALLGPTAAACTKSSTIADTARSTAATLVQAAPSIESLKIVLAHDKSKHPLTCKCAGELIEILVEALPLEALTEPIVESIEKSLGNLESFAAARGATEEVRAQARQAKSVLAAKLASGD